VAGVARAVAILARGSCGTGSVAIDGGGATPTIQLCGNEHRAIVYRADSLTPGTHTLTLTIAGGTFGFDGLVVR
jgi:Ethanolamine utilization protein EutJ (predicted chaperonin)